MRALSLLLASLSVVGSAQASFLSAGSICSLNAERRVIEETSGGTLDPTFLSTLHRYSAAYAYLAILGRSRHPVPQAFRTDLLESPAPIALSALVAARASGTASASAWREAFYARSGRFALYAAALARDDELLEFLLPLAQEDFGSGPERIAEALYLFELNGSLDVETLARRAVRRQPLVISQLVVARPEVRAAFAERAIRMHDHMDRHTSFVVGPLLRASAIAGDDVQTLLARFCDIVSPSLARFVGEVTARRRCRYHPGAVLMAEAGRPISRRLATDR